MEAPPPQSSPTPIDEIGSLVRAVEAERAGRYIVAWQEALKAISLRPFHPEAYIQMASTAVAAGDPEAALRAAQRALSLTPKWPTAQQVVQSLERTLNAHRKQRKKANLIAWPELPDSNRRPRLSVCMIVKNEERFLGQCLASVRDIADELIVIDTGSTDRTIEIAREHGAQVGHFEWCNDFAAARNASIAPATGDWILILDADEELSSAEKQNISGLLDSKNMALIRLPLINTHHGRLSKCILPRLYRNIPNVFFQGCVHEGVYTAIYKISQTWKMEIGQGDLLILHHGYSPEVLKGRKKVQRNYDLLVKAIEGRPGEAYLHMQLGLELRRMDRLADSFDSYAKALNLAETQPHQTITDEVRETLLTQYSAYLLADQQYEKVLEVLTSDLALRQPLTPGQLLVRGRALIHLRQPQYALNDVQEAYTRRDEATLFPSAIDSMGTAAELLLAEALYLNQRFEEAITCFEKSFKKSLPELRSVLAYSECLDASGKTAEALGFLRKKALEWNNLPEIWIHGIGLLMKHDELKEVAQNWFIEAASYHPNLKRVNQFLAITSGNGGA
jgi:tetratricopeptide (TPR) repeat protein